MPSVMFFKTTRRVEAGHLEYLGWAVWRHFMVLICIFFTFETWLLFTSIVWPISCETPAV